MTVVELPKVEKIEIQKLLQEQMLCRIAFKGDKYPYMAPLACAVIVYLRSEEPTRLESRLGEGTIQSNRI